MRVHVTLLFLLCVLFFSNLNGKIPWKFFFVKNMDKKNLESQQKLQKNNNNQFQFGVSECCFLPKLLFLPPWFQMKWRKKKKKVQPFLPHKRRMSFISRKHFPSWFLKKMEKQISLSERKPCKTHPKNQITRKEKNIFPFSGKHFSSSYPQPFVWIAHYILSNLFHFPAVVPL